MSCYNALESLIIFDSGNTCYPIPTFILAFILVAQGRETPERLPWVTGEPRLILVEECFFDRKRPTAGTLCKLLSETDDDKIIPLIQTSKEGEQEKVSWAWKNTKNLLVDMKKNSTPKVKIDKIFEIPLKLDRPLRLPVQQGVEILDDFLLYNVSANIGLPESLVGAHIDNGCGVLFVLDVMPGDITTWNKVSEAEETLEESTFRIVKMLRNGGF